uniref:Tr-type G domain-containing protein n=1 Tax=Salmo trutta TaxID=8032 RepID=A0A674BLS9_SALTR
MVDSSNNHPKTHNFNVGVLGHVDSGKTSLARALSSTASTAAFDKNPQSRERHHPGSSSFTMDLPEQLRAVSGCRGYDNLQFTLVDCPGHASLIRTLIGEKEVRALFWPVKFFHTDFDKLSAQGYCQAETGKSLPQTFATKLEAQTRLECHCML